MLPDLLTRLHWTAPVLARLLGCHPSLCWLWVCGERPTPEPVLTWLRALCEAHEALPVPEWRQMHRPA